MPTRHRAQIPGRGRKSVLLRCTHFGEIGCCTGEEELLGSDQWILHDLAPNLGQPNLGVSMATLSGGQQIATQLTASQNTTVTSAINSTIPTGGTSLVQVVPTPPSTATTIAGGTANSVLLGNLRTNVVNTVNLTNTVTVSGGGSVAVVNLASTTKSGEITNLVATSTTESVILQGTVNNSVSAVFAGSGTKVGAGDGGSNFLVFSGSTQNATIVSGAGADSILGGLGNDSVSLGETGVANGGFGNDTIVGGTSLATLGGGAGADSIVAGAGGGQIIGEVGNDTLVAGAGKDIFIYRTGDGNDTITGFNATQDTLGMAVVGIDLGSIIRNATVTGGNTILTLSDGSTITVAGVTGVNVNWFTIK